MKHLQKLLIAAFVLAAAAPALRAEPVAVRVPPLLWYESDPEKKLRFMMAALLYWSGKDAQSRFDLFAPLFYSYSDPDSSFALAPLFLRMKNPESTSTTLLPVYWSYRSTETAHRDYQMVLPFYFRTRTPEARTFYSPFFWAYRDAEVSQGLIPPYYWRHAAGAKTQVGFPLYWRFLRQKEDGPKDIQVAVPWFKLRSRQSSFRGFVPLYWGYTKFQDSEASTGAAADFSEWDVLLPLYYHWKNPEGGEKWITPLASRFVDADGTRFGHTGLNFFRRDPWGGKLEAMFPFFIYREQPDATSFRFLTFALDRSTDGAHARAAVWPLFSRRRDGDRSRFATPLFAWDRSPTARRGYVLNYFWKTEYDLLEPSRMVSRRHTFFPLAWHFQNPKERTTVVLPLAAFHRSGDDIFEMAFPFYFRRVTDQSRFMLVPPWMSRETPERRWSGLFFLYWRSQQEAKSAVTLLPLFRRATFPDGRSLFLAGFYHLRKGEATQGVAFPYLWDHRGRTRYEMFLPLYTNFRRPTWKVRSVFPYYRYQSRTLDEKGLFPLWAVSKGVKNSSAVFTTTEKQDPDDAEITVSTSPKRHFLAESHRLLPFYFYRRLERGGDLWLPFVFGRIERQRDEEGRFSTRGRYLLMGAWESTPTRSSHRFDPLFNYYRTRDAKGFSIPTVPFPLWRYEVDGLRSEQGPRAAGAFFPWYWRESRQMRRDLVFPLYYRRVERTEDGTKDTYRVTWLLAYFANRNYETDKSKTFVVPLYWRVASSETARTIVFPLWHERGPRLSRDIVFPLWWKFRKDGDRLTFLLPLYLRSANDKEGRATTVLPGFWKSRDREGSTLLAGNVFIKDRPATQEHLAAVFPVYFHHDRKRLGWKVLFPLYWRFRTAESIVRILPPFYSIASRTSAQRVSGFAPLYTYSRDPDRDWKNFEVLGGLFGYEREGERSHVTLLYLFRI